MEPQPQPNCTDWTGSNLSEKDRFAGKPAQPDEPDVFTETNADWVSHYEKLKVGEKYKITGGKYKKYKVGILVKINKTYSDVKIEENAVMIATGNIGSDKEVKIKNCYLFAVDVPGIEMPDTDDLVVVDDLSKWLEENPGKFPESFVEEKANGTLMVNELGEVVDDISDVLPSIDEALQLRNDNIALKKEIDILKEEHANTIKNMVDMSKIGLSDAQLGEIISLLVKFKV